MKVLVIEDSPFYRKLFSHFFDQHSIQYTSVAHGLHGIEACDENQFDVIFVDINLPDVSGWEVISCLLREQGAGQVIPMTGYETESSKMLFRTINPGKFLVKPFAYEELGDFFDVSTEIIQEDLMKPVFSNVDAEMKENLLCFCSEMGVETSRQLLEIFCSEINSKVPQLKALNEQGHWSEIESSVHQLKSNCRYFGFNDYAETCDQVEKLIVKGFQEEIEHHISELIDKSDSILSVVSEVLVSFDEGAG